MSPVPGQLSEVLRVKLKSEFLSHNYGGESLLVPTANAVFSGIVKGNDTFGAIVECLKTDTTEDEITDTLLSRFDAPREVVAADVARAVSELRRIGAIDE